MRYFLAARKSMLLCVMIGCLLLAPLLPVAPASARTAAVSDEPSAPGDAPLGRWVQSLAGQPRVLPPVVIDDTVVVSSQYGELAAFSLADGAEIWHSRSGALEPPDAARTPPGDGAQPAPTPSLGQLPAADASALSLLRERLAGPPVSYGSRIVVTSVGGSVKVLDAGTGTVHWASTLPEPLIGSRTLGDLVLVAAGQGLIALDVEDGSTRWRVPLPGSPVSPPVAVESAPSLTVVATVDSLIAVNAQSGIQQWRVDMASRITAPLAVTGDLVVVGRESGEVLAFDTGTGSVAWRFMTTGRVSAPPVVSGDAICIASEDGALYALDPATGSPRWIFSAGVSLYSAPVLWDQSLALATGGGVVGLDPLTGSLRWRLTMRADQVAAAPDGTLLVTSDLGQVYALGDPDAPMFQERNLPDPAEPSEGAPVPGGASGRGFAPGSGPLGELSLAWTAGQTLVSNPAAIAGGLAVVVGDDAVVYAFDVATGASRWRYAATERSIYHPVIVGETVVVLFNDGAVVGLGLADGAMTWSRDGSPAQPTSAFGAAIVATSNGIAAVSPETGDVLWEVPDFGTSVAAGEDVLYATGAAGLVAIDPVDGTERWTVPNADGELVVTDSSVLVVGNAIRAYEADTGAALYVTRPEGVRILSAAVRHGIGYAQLEDGDLWTFDLVTGSGRWRVPSPVDGGYPRGIVLAADTLYAGYGGESNEVFAFDLNGEPLWNLTLPEAEGTHVAPPSVAYGMVFIAAGSLYAVTGVDNPPLDIPGLPDPVDPNVPVIDPLTIPVAIPGGNVGCSGIQPGPGPVGSPSLLWELTTRGASAPVVENGIVYTGSQDGSITARDLQSGDDRWSYAASAPASAPTVANGNLYVVAGRELVWLDAATGDPRWAYPADLGGVPLVVGTTIIVNAKMEIAALEEAGQRALPLWRYACENLCSEPAMAGDLIFVNDSGDVAALDIATGEERWRAAIGEVAVFGPAPNLPAVADGVVFAGIGDLLAALDAATGEERWSVDIGDTITSPAAISSEIVVVGTDFGEVVALSIEDGSERWRFDTGDSVVGQPAVAEQTIYVTSLQGSLTALDLSNGEELWSHETGYESETAAVVIEGIVVAAFSHILIALGASP
jgi:outer membrane protein assembly factor BamB